MARSLSALRYLLGATLCLPAVLAGSNYTIRTIAGSNNVGDNGPATAAFVSILEGVCADGAGNVYIADADDNRIRRIDASGTITTYAGTGIASSSGDGGPANQATLRNPYGIRIDGLGNLFIADLGNGRIRKVDRGGTISTVASGLNQPRNLAIDPTGNIYVSEFGANRVSQLQGDGSLRPIAGTGAAGSGGDGGPATAAQLNGPAGIAFDARGTLFIADSGNQLIRRVTPDGVISTFFGGDPNFRLSAPTGLTTDSGGNLYVAQAGYPAVSSIDTSGMRHTLPGAGRDLYLAPNGDLLVVGQEHLETVHSDGSVMTLFSSSSFTFGDGGPATEGRFESVVGVAADAGGNVYIADQSFSRIRVVNAAGTLGSLPGSAYVTHPSALALDKSGRLLAADQIAITILTTGDLHEPVVTGLTTPASAIAFDPDGTLFFTSGNGVFSAHSDGTATALPYTAATPSLSGIAIDKSGMVYVADSAGSAVRKLAADGSATLFAGNGSGGFSGDEGPASGAQLSAPSGIAFDAAGNLWIADTGNNRVRYVDTTGVIHTANDGFSAPVAVAPDSSGNIFVADSGSRRILELSVGKPPQPDTSGILTPAHAATFQAGPVVGGEIISLFGVDLGPSSGLGATLDNSGKVATTLGDTQVLINGVPAPLFYVGATQVNAQVPVEVSGQVSASIELRRGGTTKATATADVAPYSPGLFAGSGFAAALDASGGYNTADNPAHPGSILILFGTGFGDTSPLEQTGVPANVPLARPIASVSMTIGGKPAQILYAGDAPGFVGLTQLNILIPDGIPSGKAEVRVNVGTSSSPSGIFLHTR